MTRPLEVQNDAAGASGVVNTATRTSIKEFASDSRCRIVNPLTGKSDSLIGVLSSVTNRIPEAQEV